MKNRSLLFQIPQLPKSTSSRRPPAQQSHPLPAHICQTSLTYQAPAALPIPPLLGFSVFAALATLWLNLTPLTEFVVSRLLKTRCKLSSLSLNPLRQRYSLNDLQLFDPRGRPLFSLQQASLSFSRKEGSRVLDVQLVRPEVITIFDTYDFSESNWTLLARNFRSKSDDGQPESKTSRSVPRKLEVDSDKPSSDHKQLKTSPRSGMKLNLRVKDGIVLSIRSDVLGGKRLVDDLLIRDVQLRSEDFEDFESIKALVDNLSIRAMKSFPISSFPREFRTGVRRYARLMVSQSIAERLKSSKKNIKKLRENISFADEFVMKDLPDLQGARETAKSMQKILERFEELLDTDSSSRSDADRSSPAVNDNQQSREQNPDDAGSPSPVDQYRELDEEYVPRKR